MKKFITILILFIFVFTLTSCETNKRVSSSDKAWEERKKQIDKFFPDHTDGKVYSPELLIEYYDFFMELEKNPAGSQEVVLDLRSSDDFEKSHFIGATNITVIDKDTILYLLTKIPEDYHTFVYSYTTQEAEEFVTFFRNTRPDNYWTVYYIEGGYDAIVNTEGSAKYITTDTSFPLPDCNFKVEPEEIEIIEDYFNTKKQ